MIQKCYLLHDGGYNANGVSVYVGDAWGRLYRETALATLADCMEGGDYYVWRDRLKLALWTNTE